MARSIITFDGDGVTTTFPLSFTLGILRREYITCHVDNEVDGLGAPVYRDLEWISDGLVTVLGAPAVESVVFYRTIPKTALIHDYSDNAPITETNLDQSNLQLMMIIHEFMDGRLEGGFSENISMNGARITDLGDGIEDTDAATMGQMNEAVANAESSEDAAAASAAAAAASASAAASSASAASSSQSAAATSASSASTSATAAASSATSASGSASAASTSATNAASSATAAAASATAASGSQTAAAASATNAASSATAASGSASAAAASASAASSSETNALASATAAAISATLADASADLAASYLSTIETDPTDRVLAEPTVDLLAVREVNPIAGVTVTRAGTATRVNVFGRIESVSANTIRHDYDPATRAYRGWLLEESSTNSFLHSEDLTNAAYSTSQLASVTANAAVGPDGSASLEKITPNTTATTHYIRQSVTKAASAIAATASTFLSANGYNYARLYLSSASTGNSCLVDVDLVNGTISNVSAAGSFSNPEARIENWGNGLYRVSISGTTDTLTTLYLYIFPMSAPGVINFAGNGTSGINAGFVQMELNKNAMTSYIPTAAATVTRNDDAVQLLSSAFTWLNSTEGTLFVEGDIDGAMPASSTSAIPATLGDGTTNNMVRFRTLTATSLRADYAVGGSVVGLFDATIVANAPYRAALSYNAAGQNFGINGVSSSPGAAAAVPAFDRILIGSSGPGTSIMQRGHVRRVLYFPIKLSASDLALLTQ